jgi:hypothetical protein
MQNTIHIMSIIRFLPLCGGRPMVHQQWYATHLDVVYLHAKYEKPVLNDKKVTARTRFLMNARTSLNCLCMTLTFDFRLNY